MKPGCIAALVLLPLAASGDGLPTDLLQSTTGAVQTAQLTPLQETKLDGAAKEVRIWIGFYNVQEFKLVRFRVDAAGQVQGESYFLYLPMTSSAESEYYDRIRSQCQEFNRSQDWETCRPNKAVGVHWDSAYRALQSLGLWDQDASKLPSPGPKGGPTVLVELRSGDSYRAYAFNDPGESKSPQAQKAAKLLAIVDGLVGMKMDEEQEEDRD